MREISRERDTAECQLSDVIKAKPLVVIHSHRVVGSSDFFLAFDEVVGDFLLSFHFFWRLPSETQAQFRF